MVAVRGHSQEMKRRVIAVGLLGLALAAGSGTSGASRRLLIAMTARAR
jgi:hypothetical protein